MKSYPNRGLILLCLLLAWPIFRSQATNYYLATYDLTGEGMPYDVNVKMIHLENGSIVEAVNLLYGGCLLNNKPIKISIRHRDYYLFMLEKGIYAKNSGPRPETTYVFILDDSLNIIRNPQIPNSSVSTLEQYENEEGFRFGLTVPSDTAHIFPEGIYEFDREFRFRRMRGFFPSIGPGDIRELGGFEYLRKLNNNPDNIFYAHGDSGYFLLKLNADNSSIISSIPLARRFASKIFAYHPVTQRIYLFYLNYEQHGKFANLEKHYSENWIQPEVLIYDPVSLELIESHNIADFTPGNYPAVEKGQAEIVGDFIVYYFFEDEWIGRFNPAMLFIFDTRTNEATWLRVGWR